VSLALAMPVCFARGRTAPRDRIAVDASGLPRDVAQALSNALPFLRCGEESAVHAFGRRLARNGIAAEQAALDAITADEARHAAWLEALAQALPAGDTAPDAVAMATFFRRLLTRDPALHFARIAALDLAVCAILRPLAGRHGALAASPPVTDGLRAIHRDEARHVRTARHCAARLGWSTAQQRSLDQSMRGDLAALLEPVRASLLRLGFTGFAAMPAAHDA
jgi:hypothetical protein